MVETLKVQLPDLYYMYVNGLVDVTSLYKYVDKETGLIRYRARYRHIYDYYYDYYPRLGGVHLYYRPRLNNPPPISRPRQPRIEPNRPHNPGGNRPPQVGGGNRPPQGGGNRPPQGGGGGRPPQGHGNGGHGGPRR